MRARIEVERRSLAGETAKESLSSRQFPQLIAEFERLSVDREFAEEAYRAALAALDLARAKADRQSRYLATYEAPTLAETAEYPRRVTLMGLAALFLGLSWAVLALILYAVRDRA